MRHLGARVAARAATVTPTGRASCQHGVAPDAPERAGRGWRPAVRRLCYLGELSVLLVVVRRRLARHGFQATVAWATTPSRRARERSVDEGRAVAELAAAQARRVFRWHPVANKCLEQSLLLCRFLGRRGVKAELVMAVRKYPFESHAWARLGDLPLTDPPESHPEHFRVVARF